MTPSKGSSESVWKAEAEFFDAQASTTVIEPLDLKVIARYTGTLKPWLAPEYRLSLIRENLAGKTVLVVGCGEGETVALLAALGAKVTGIDISAGAIRVAKARMERNGLSAELIVGPIESFVPPLKYDFVYVEALLHHVLHDLDNVMAGLVRCCSRRLVFAEPINLCPSLRALRVALGKPNGTPDERPLEEADLGIMRRHMPTMHTRHFRILGRLGKIILHGPYETSPSTRRLAYDVLMICDRLLLSFPRACRFSSVAVINFDVQAEPEPFS